MRESQFNANKEGNRVEKKKMNSGTPERREREHGFYVIPIETGDYHTKVYPSLVIHPI